MPYHMLCVWLYPQIRIPCMLWMSPMVCALLISQSPRRATSPQPTPYSQVPILSDITNQQATLLKSFSNYLYVGYSPSKSLWAVRVFDITAANLFNPIAIYNLTCESHVMVVNVCRYTSRPSSILH